MNLLDLNIDTLHKLVEFLDFKSIVCLAKTCTFTKQLVSKEPFKEQNKKKCQGYIIDFLSSFYEITRDKLPELTAPLLILHDAFDKVIICLSHTAQIFHKVLNYPKDQEFVNKLLLKHLYSSMTGLELPIHHFNNIFHSGNMFYYCFEVEVGKKYVFLASDRTNPYRVGVIVDTDRPIFQYTHITSSMHTQVLSNLENGFKKLFPENQRQSVTPENLQKFQTHDLWKQMLENEADIDKKDIEVLQRIIMQHKQILRRSFSNFFLYGKGDGRRPSTECAHKLSEVFSTLTDFMEILPYKEYASFMRQFSMLNRLTRAFLFFPHEIELKDLIVQDHEYWTSRYHNADERIDIFYSANRVHMLQLLKQIDLDKSTSASSSNQEVIYHLNLSRGMHLVLTSSNLAFPFVNQIHINNELVISFLFKRDRKIELPEDMDQDQFKKLLSSYELYNVEKIIEAFTWHLFDNGHSPLLGGRVTPKFVHHFFSHLLSGGSSYAIITLIRFENLMRKADPGIFYKDDYEFYDPCSQPRSPQGSFNFF